MKVTTTVTLSEGAEDCLIYAKTAKWALLTACRDSIKIGHVYELVKLGLLEMETGFGRGGIWTQITPKGLKVLGDYER